MRAMRRSAPGRALGLAVLFLLATVAGVAAAQEATPLPGASTRAWTLPDAPTGRGLPGPDPRQCGTSLHDALCAIGRWSRFTRMTVTLKSGAFTGKYEMERTASGEVLTLFSETSPSKRRGGEVLIVGDDAFAYRTRETVPADIDMLDYLLAASNMTTQLVAILLDQAVLEAPSAVTAPRAVAGESATQYIRTDTPNTAAAYAPPWKVTGTVRPQGGGAIAFDLAFQYRPVDKRGKPQPGRVDRIALTGVVTYGDLKPSMPDTFDLVGWKLIRGGSPVAGVSTLSEARRVAGS